MARFETKVHVGSDHRLTAILPAEFANSDVLVRVEAIANLPASGPRNDREEFRRILDKVVGSIDDPTFERPPQLGFERREPLD